jgi:glycosyltransferase involved in cell wall biosynthesis
METDGRSWPSLHAISLVGAHVPRRCGIGTYTSDLSESLANAAPRLDTWAVAMNDRPEGYRYPPRVWFEINQHRPGDYRMAADFLNMSNIEVCLIQHEFGIYGGEWGEHILELLKRLRMPVVTTMHTVLQAPTALQHRITQQLGEQSDRLIVLAEKGRELLRDMYDLPSNNITFIPHGIPEIPFVEPHFYKDQYGVEGREVLLTFGLLGPTKGIENMIEALPRVVEKHPNVVYIVLGATHPGVAAQSGEAYRLSLKRRARELGVEHNVAFINKFVSSDELMAFLGACDLYISPYRGPDQIVSGTLAYALGAGKAVVSTPYWYATEMLADGRGQLVPFDDPEALAAAVDELLRDEGKRHAMRKRAYQFTRKMTWPRVAEQHLALFQAVRQQRDAVRGRSLSSPEASAKTSN